MDVSINGGTQQPWVFLLTMIILGCFGGTPIFGNTHITYMFTGSELVASCSLKESGSMRGVTYQTLPRGHVSNWLFPLGFQNFPTTPARLGFCATFSLILSMLTYTCQSQKKHYDDKVYMYTKRRYKQFR